MGVLENVQNRGCLAVKQEQPCIWKTKFKGKHAKLKNRSKCVVGLQNNDSLTILPGSNHCKTIVSSSAHLASADISRSKLLSESMLVACAAVAAVSQVYKVIVDRCLSPSCSC